MTYYKFTDTKGLGLYSHFDFGPYLPKNGKSGKWLPKVEDLEKCARGYHACKADQLCDWLNERMFEVEYRGKVEDYGDKVNGAEMRFVREMPGWNEKNQRLAACDIAESVLHIFEKKHPKDKRPRECIETARRYANGKATQEELAAARDAARGAARGAAWDAASKIALKYARKR